MTHTTDVTTHPDLAEMKARYERAGHTSTAGLLDGLVFLAGLFLLVSPFVIGGSTGTRLMANNTVIGIVLVLLAIGFARSFDRLHTIAWVLPVIGLWEIVAPWAIYHAPLTNAIDMTVSRQLSTSGWVGNVVAGGVVLIAGAAIASFVGGSGNKSSR
jgi:hypothetical protein